MEAGFYNIAMWHKVFEIMFFAGLSFVGFILLLWIFAVVTYKIAHKKTKKNPVKKVKKINTEIEYNIGDRNEMFLFQIRQEENKMRRQLIANI